jgi:HK97 family phage prohead protease
VKHKTLRDVKVADEGLVEAVFATLDVVDKDGDVIVPGAIEDGDAVRISAYNHASWAEALPVGRGTVHEQGDEAILAGRFFMDTTGGRETFQVVKEMSDLQEWSFGFDVLDSATEQRDGEEVNVLRKMKVYEVAPVLLGAGVNTRTLGTKGVKGAIPAHSTETTGGSWDGPGAMSNCPAEQAALRAICAWVDSSGDPDAKSSYKFPHHARPGGPANTTACSAIIAALNGGRGGASIPDSDRRGVYAHAARHLRDAGADVPELRGDEPEETKTFTEEAMAAHDALTHLLTRATSLAEVRERDRMTVVKRAQLQALDSTLEGFTSQRDELQKLLADTDPEQRRNVLDELDEFQLDRLLRC